MNDANGHSIKAVVDLTFYGAEFQQFLQLAAKKPGAIMDAGTTPSVGNPVIDKIIQTARQFTGTKHVIGGLDKNGIDCSGLTMTAFAAAGIQLPRVSGQQASGGTPIDRKSLRKGDLVFFATGAPGSINHVGIVSDTSAGDVQFIHASTSKGVMESKLSENYWNKAYMAARRVV